MVRPLALAGVAAVLCSLAAQAHVVYGAKTLHGLTAESDLVLRARIVSVDAGPTASAPQGSRPGVEAEVLEVVKGRFDDPRVHFAQHGHGVARFEPGDETLLFLLDVARSRELDVLAGRYDWVSLQEHQDEYTLAPATRDPLLAAVRAYVAAAGASPEAGMASLRAATLGLLTSGDAALAASAVRDLVMAPPAVALVTSEELPALRRVLDDPDVSMGVRVGLLSELERRKLVDGAATWQGLLSDDTPPGDRITAIRAAGTLAPPPVRARLIELVADPDANVAAAAAVALGKPGQREAVAALATALSHDSATVRMAAIRGLGQIATPEARQALQVAADSHPDAATQRRARAELRKGGRRGG